MVEIKAEEIKAGGLPERSLSLSQAKDLAWKRFCRIAERKMIEKKLTKKKIWQEMALAVGRGPVVDGVGEQLDYQIDEEVI